MEEMEMNIINSFVQNGFLEIEMDYGFQALYKHRANIALIAEGVPYSELGYAAMRAEQAPEVIYFKGQNNIISDSFKLSDDTIPNNSIALLTLSGVMQSETGLCNRGIDALCKDFLAAYQNPQIGGILLKASTGGGESAAGSRLQAMINGSPKAVVVYTDTILASAGVRGTVTADEIIAAEGAQIGSIGTYSTVPKGFSERYKKYNQDIYADKSTNKNKSFRAFLDGNLEELRAEINTINDQFLSEVVANRTLKGSAKTIENTLSGAMFSAQEAKRRGLVDGVGGFQYALERTIANIKRRKES